MFWRRPKPRVWLIDPSSVGFGSVVTRNRRNLSRSHVKVWYHEERHAQFVPLVDFVQLCNQAIREGRSLEIDRLLVAPVLKQRYSKFFDRLTDWTPATRRALRSMRHHPQPVLTQ